MQLSGEKDDIKGAKEESLSCIHCCLFCSSEIKLIMVIESQGEELERSSQYHIGVHSIEGRDRTELQKCS